MASFLYGLHPLFWNLDSISLFYSTAFVDKIVNINKCWVSVFPKASDKTGLRVHVIIEDCIFAVPMKM